MGKRLKPARDNLDEYHAKISQDMMIEFRDQIKFASDIEKHLCDHRKLSDYNLQQFRDFVASKIKDF